MKLTSSILFGSIVASEWSFRVSSRGAATAAAVFLVQVSISGPNDFKRLSERGINLGPACAARGHKKRLVSKMMNLV